MFIRKLALMGIMSAMLGAGFANAQPICPDGRSKMVCDLKPEVEKTEKWYFNISAKVKKIFNGSTGGGREVAQKIDTKLERFKAINQSMCNFWNACMPMDVWQEYDQRQRKFLEEADSRTDQQKGTDIKNLEYVLNKAEALERFYDKAIPDEYKRDEKVDDESVKDETKP